jgi:hypothetical protein
LPPAGGYAAPEEDEDIPFNYPFIGDEHLTNEAGDPIA